MTGAFVCGRPKEKEKIEGLDATTSVRDLEPGSFKGTVMVISVRLCVRAWEVGVAHVRVCECIRAKA